MKKVLSSILITVVLFANILAPVSVGWGDKNELQIIKKISEAEGTTLISANPKDNGKSVGVNGVFQTNEKIDILYVWYFVAKDSTSLNSSKLLGSFKDEFTETDVIKTVSGTGGNILNYFFGQQIYKYAEIGNSELLDLIKNDKYFVKVKISKLTDDKKGEVFIGESEVLQFTAGIPSQTGDAFTPEGKAEAQKAYDNTIASGGTTTEALSASAGSGSEKARASASPESFMPVCMGRGGSVPGCVGQILYYLFFVPTSALFALAGTFFDYTFAYSVNDDSYRSAFVVQGWNVVRDFCNMFFIFVLLYIAFKTILDLNGAKTKEMIVNVVIIGLLINFSLFATRVIIDVSNVLARVFYNSNTIQITALDEDGGGNEVTDTIARMNTTGVLPLSSALVNKVNPQALIINADKMGDLPDKAGQIDQSEYFNSTKNKGGVTPWTFIFVTLLASAINVVGFIVFLTVGMMFVVRVVGLWLAMIMAPFAFFSYTVPEMQNLDMVGLKKWWPETLKLAFLAPVFIFFIYLILQFLETGLGVIDASNKTGMLNFSIAVLVPFAFIMVLLMQAKKIAVKMAGQMGEGVAKFGSTVGGLALGAGVGLGAMAMRGTIGRAGSALANSDRVKGWEKKGYLGAATLRNIGKSAGSGSMDIRGTKLGASAGKGLGVDMGKAKEGGFEKIKAEKIDKRVKRAKELEMGEGSKKKRESSNLEASLRAAKSEQASSLSKWEREITKQRQELTDAKNAKDKTAMADAKLKLDNAKKELEKLKNAPTSHGGSINYIESELNRVNDEINAAEIKSMNDYAKNMESMGNKTLNYFKSFGQHSGVGANIAADRIRKGVKIENTTK